MLISTVLSAADKVPSQADIRIVDNQELALTLEVADREGRRAQLALTRSTAQEPWVIAPATGDVGIWFGNPEPRFAGPAMQRNLGISAQEAFRAITPEIATRPMDDLTVYRLHTPGSFAIALWQQGAITEIWDSGEMVYGFICTPPTPDLSPTAERVETEARGDDDLPLRARAPRRQLRTLNKQEQVAVELLGEMLDRMQVIIDIEHAKRRTDEPATGAPTGTPPPPPPPP